MAFTVYCRQCHWQWDAALTLPMPIDRALIAMRGIVAAGCPKCGARGASIMCGPARPAGVQGVTNGGINGD